MSVIIKRPKLKKSKPNFMRLSDLIDAAIILIIFAFLLSYFKPSLLLLDTTTAGGDTASHSYPLYYLARTLMPNGQLIGWSPGWYAGFPMLQFYFLPSFVLMSILGVIIPLNVAFKLVTVSGIFLLPVAAYFSMRMMRFRFPLPVIAAVFTLPFLFMEANSMWGGNIPSTLAGEFSYSISLALTVLFFGSLHRGITRGKGMLRNVLIFTFVTLTHVYTMLFAVLTSGFFLIQKDRGKFKKNFKYLFVLYAFSAMLSAFWLIPLVTKLDYTISYNYVWKIKGWTEMFPTILLPLYLLGIVGCIRAIVKGDERIAFFIFSLLAASLLYFMASRLGIVDIRFVPFIQFFPIFCAVYTLGGVSKELNKKLSPNIAGTVIAVVVLLMVLAWVNGNVTYIGHWIKWNYEGFEEKSMWPQYSTIMNYIKGDANDPRVVYEHSALHDSAGSLRAFESIPLFSGRSTLEGLYMQSTPTSPFVFYIQSQISNGGSCPLPGYSCTFFDPGSAAKRLKMFNVKHVIARTDRVKDALSENENYILVKDDASISPYQIYELVESSQYVTVPKYEPVSVDADDWKKFSYDWFKRDELLDIPLVFNADNTDGRFTLTSDNLDLPRTELVSDCNIEERIGNQEIEFITNCVGKPHIISVSYYPNWHVEGADKIYLVSPSFMMVYPDENKVTLRYGENGMDWLGQALTYGSILFMGLAILSRKQKLSRVLNL